jgi:hypothetical protein
MQAIVFASGRGDCVVLDDERMTQNGPIARLVQRLSKRVPLGSGDLSKGPPVIVPLWVVLGLRTAAILLVLYFAWKLLFA